MKKYDEEKFTVRVVQLYDTFIKDSEEFSNSESLGAAIYYISNLIYNISANLPFVTQKDGELETTYKMDRVFEILFKQIIDQTEVFEVLNIPDVSKEVH